jgi:hypothetical protein
MTSCFTWLLLLAGAVFVMVSIIRWFEQVTDAVDRRWWNKVVLLLAMPLMAWFYPSRVAAGRPTMVPHHEPVQGFGVGPVMPTQIPTNSKATPRPPPKRPRSGVDPDKLAKLKQKMREQGMLEDSDEG